LGYFARINDQEAIPLIEERLAKSDDKSGSSIFFYLTRVNFTEGMENLLRKRLESDESDVASTASYYLSKYGGKENKKLIETRHNRWLKEWGERDQELDNPKADATTRNQAMLQVNLLESLIGAKSWNLSKAEIYQLKLKCVTQTCRQYFGNRE
jgi:hypothetical protein